MTTSIDRPRQLLLDSLHTVGYRRDHVEINWPYLNLSALGEGNANTLAGRLDIAAFDDERRHDWETSALACDLQSPDVLNSADAGLTRSRMLFEATAAPNVIFGGRDTVDLWLRCESNSPRRVAGIGLDTNALRRAFRDNRDDLDRESLARLRGGQRYLFDRLHDARRDELAGFLHVGLEQAVRLLRKKLGSLERRKREEFELSLAHVAMALLAARIMEDKEFFGERNRPSRNARKLLEQAESASNGFFRHVIGVDLSKLDKQLGRREVDEILPHVMAHLTGPACFSLITPDMLGDFYERALVANGHSGRSVDIKGIHYTPLTLAKRILQRIPIEEIPPSKRYIADLACGSGSFLMAATSRLRESFDANEPDTEEDVHSHLTSRIFGNDVDNIALLVTRMRYLLNHWIETGSPDDVPTPKLMDVDGLKLKLNHFGGIRPTVIVGNPPFNPANTAAEFLKAAVQLLAPVGYVGMIMPAAFLRGRRDRSPEARHELLNACELLEVWEMPQGTVGIAARHSPCVVIARKMIQPDQASPVTFKVAHSGQDGAVAAFRDHLRSTWSFVAKGLPGKEDTHWRDDPYRVSKSNPHSLCRIIASPIDFIWQAADTSCTMGDVCGEHIVPGIWACGPESVFSNRDDQPGGFEPYFQHQGRLVPYILKRSDWSEAGGVRGLYVDPETARWKKKPYWPLYRRTKILATASSNRNARTQIVADYLVFSSRQPVCWIIPIKCRTPSRYFGPPNSRRVFIGLRQAIPACNMCRRIDEKAGPIGAALASSHYTVEDGR